MEFLRTLLSALYGEASSQAAWPALSRLIEDYAFLQSDRARSRAPLPLTQGDILLITYADQVAKPGEPPLRTLAEFCEKRIADLISGIHLLPFYPSSSDDGFAVIDYRAVAPETGDWFQIELLARRFSLMFDAVFNHVSARSAWFQSFLDDKPPARDFFITVEDAPDLSGVVRPRALPLLTTFETAAGPKRVWTTFSADQIDLNLRNPSVLTELLETLLFYVSKGARFIRLDAIAYLWKEPGTSCLHRPQTHLIIQIMRALLDQVAPHVLLITETNVPHAENISYFGDGTNEAQLVYNFALPPLVLHTFLTGQSIDLTRWASRLQVPSPQVGFLNFLTSHDGIGLNPVRGILPETAIEKLVQETIAHGGLVLFKNNPDGSQTPYELNITYFDALSNPHAQEPLNLAIARFIAAHGIMLSLAGLPGIYFPSLFGSRNDRAAAESTGIPRRINRQKFPLGSLQSALANPESHTARVYTQFAPLLRVRRSEPAFDPGAAQFVLALDPRIFVVLRQADRTGDRLLCVHNVTPSPFRLAIQLPDLRPGQLWLDLLRRETHVVSIEQKIVIELAPYQVLWLKNERERNSGSHLDI